MGYCVCYCDGIVCMLLGWDSVYVTVMGWCVCYCYVCMLLPTHNNTVFTMKCMLCVMTIKVFTVKCMLSVITIRVFTVKCMLCANSTQSFVFVKQNSNMVSQLYSMVYNSRTVGLQCG